jgi:hypothetical protein
MATPPRKTSKPAAKAVGAPESEQVVESAAHVVESAAHVAEPEAHVPEPEAHVPEPAAHVAEPEAHVPEPAALVAEPAALVAEPLKALVEAVQAVAAETAEKVKTFDPAKALESVKAVEAVKTREIVAEVAKVQQAAKEAVTETVQTLESSFGAASKSLHAFSAKALEAYQANAVASVSYLQALSGVRSISEAIALQSDHARKQYESLSAQAKELTALAQQVASDAAGPFKDQIGKVFKPK